MQPRAGARVAVAFLATTLLTLVAVPSAPVEAATSDVHPFGDAPTLDGDTAGDAVAAAVTPDGRGLVLTSASGHVDVLGTAAFAGEVTERLAAPIVDVLVTPTGRGYWLVARDGGVFTFGDAAFHGSTGDIRLNQPIVAAASTSTGRGYWLVARDGGVFTFGDAAFHGSTGDIRLNQPIVAAAPTPTGQGYRLLARDGGVFTFGDATFEGAAVGALAADRAAVAIEATPTGRGYWIVSGPGGIRLAFAGDVHGERHLGDRARRGEPLLADVASVIGAADVTAVNLETPLGPPGTPQQKAYVFLGPPELATGLAAGGVDVVSLANNHALDHGAGALLRTIDIARSAGLGVVGAGRNAAEAYAPAVIDVRGRRVAFIGLSLVVPPGWAATGSRPGVASAYDTRAALSAVRAARAEADVVVVLVHWGVELSRCPSDSIAGLADALHDAGAAVVAGHHPHVLQGIESAPDRVTAYSLGNFVWYHNNPPSDLSGLLEVTVDASASLTSTFHPARISDQGTPQLLGGTEADRVRAAVVGQRCG